MSFKSELRDISRYLFLYFPAILFYIVSIYFSMNIFSDSEYDGGPACVVDMLQSMVSVDGTYEARLYHNTCGALTADLTVLSLKTIKTGSQWHERLITEDDEKKLKIYWESDKKLIVKGVTFENLKSYSKLAGGARVTLMQDK